ncbi:GNAT family N-acetyltransferase [Defluviimonas sp. WL0002]|uniref:GNAT family N-acetyltransferase n=1 Tax=Albidovulum marisflavi TaxID=2984159 RepID=A0ABT2ZGR0_9RHOB|nr:GNAT family N-acetyltransferase [Defluviimonas sp. WL0002]MCV2870304.1 GNAT family N-acetyltransferase [Defluviimonas sp. WL0002]
MSESGLDRDPRFRLATDRDLPAILPLARSTVPGFVDELWSRLAGNGETAEEFGRRAQHAFIEVGQTIVADAADKISAMLISYPMASSPNPHVPGMDDMLRPLMTLFQKAQGTWYLHGIATVPDFEGQGLASGLMHVAEDLGRSAGKSRISLLVIDTNLSAIRFYDRRGYATTATAPVVKKGWQTTAKDLLLMEKPLG